MTEDESKDGDEGVGVRIKEVSKDEIANSLVILKNADKFSQCCEKVRRGDCYYYAFYQNNSSGQIRGYLVVDKCCQKIYCVFLGTKGWRDLRFDLKFKKVSSPFGKGLSSDNNDQSKSCATSPSNLSHAVRRDDEVVGKIHYGFYQVYREVQLELNTLLNRMKTKYPDYQLVLVGHSMGGVLAIFCSIQMILQGNSPSVLAFCLPKLGDACFNRSLLQFYEKYETPFYRTRNFWDPVTRLPPSIFGYESLYKYQTGSNCTECRKLNRKPHGIVNFS